MRVKTNPLSTHTDFSTKKTFPLMGGGTVYFLKCLILGVVLSRRTASFKHQYDYILSHDFSTEISGKIGNNSKILSSASNSHFLFDEY